MKVKTVHQKLEDIARKYFGVNVLFFKPHANDSNIVSNLQIEKALKAAYLAGERAGYKHGFDEAKQVCDCDIKSPMSDVFVPPMAVDFEKELV